MLKIVFRRSDVIQGINMMYIIIPITSRQVKCASRDFSNVVQLKLSNSNVHGTSKEIRVREFSS